MNSWSSLGVAPFKSDRVHRLNFASVLPGDRHLAGCGKTRQEGIDNGSRRGNGVGLFSMHHRRTVSHFIPSSAPMRVQLAPSARRQRPDPITRSGNSDGNRFPRTRCIFDSCDRSTTASCSMFSSPPPNRSTYPRLRHDGVWRDFTLVWLDVATTAE
jgi:hypothetical protein